MYSEEELKQINLLIQRLEHLSADSIWAHRASGIRGSLLKSLEDQEFRSSQETSEFLKCIIDQGYFILEQAAKITLLKKRHK